MDYQETEKLEIKRKNKIYNMCDSYLIPDLFNIIVEYDKEDILYVLQYLINYIS